jgi:RHS repeat-associated protein
VIKIDFKKYLTKIPFQHRGKAMNSENVTRISNLSKNVVRFALASICLLLVGSTTSAQNTQTTQGKADQNLKSSARVNPSTLAMEFSLPLGNYPGRAGNSMPVVFSYSSKVWDMRMVNNHSEMVNVPGNPLYQHLVTNTTDVGAFFADNSASGWKTSLKPFQIISFGEMFNGYGGLFAGGMPGSNGQYREWGCVVVVEGQFYSPSCESGIMYMTMESCCDEDYHCEVRTTEHCIGPINTGTTQSVKTVYRFRIQMPDGSINEFRKDDRVRDCIADSNNCSETGDGSYLSVDGSGMRFEHNEVQSNQETRDVLYLSDGSKYIFPVIQPTPDYGKLVDRNGNFSLYDPGNMTWTDTMGREIVDPLPATFPLNNERGTYPVTLKGTDNAELTYQMEWTNLHALFEDTHSSTKYRGPDKCDSGILPAPVDGNHLFDNQTPDHTDDQTENQTRYISVQRVCAQNWGTNNSEPFDPLVLASIMLPNGKAYVFKYNEYGEITKITYPTGGYERFEYAHIDPIGVTAREVYTQGNRGVTKRYVSFDGVTEGQEWTYSGGGVITTIAPDGSKTERVLHESVSSGFGFEDPRNGMVKEERVFDTNGVLRSRTLNDWVVLEAQGQDAYSEAKRDPRVKRSVSIMLDPNSTSALATLTEIDYDEGGSTDPTNFPQLNAKRKKSYHYAVIQDKTTVDTEAVSWSTVEGWFPPSKLAAISETDFSYNSSYRARGIIGLPVETRALNPANTSDVLAKSQPLYDQANTYPIINAGTAATWADPNSSLRGNLTTNRTWEKETNSWLETHAQYDNFGNLRKAWDASGDITKYVETEYSPDYAYAYPTKVISPAPEPTNVHGTNSTSSVETTYDLTTGLVLSVKDDFGQILKTEYNDPLLRPTRVFGDNFTAPIAETIYDDNARTVKVRKQLDEINWDEATTYLDSMGRPVKTVAKDSEGDINTETHYDLLGRVDRVTNPYRAGDTVYWNKTRYDEMGRPVESFAPATLADINANSNLVSLGITTFGISSVTNYVGTVVTTMDASGRKGRSITNALGQLLRVDEPTAINSPNDLGDIGSPNQPTYYKYDPYGNMVQVTQGVQNRYFKYNALGRLIRINQPEQEYHSGLDLPDDYNTSGHWTAAFTYDDLGNVITATDAKGVTIANTYDRAGRVITRAYYGAPPSTPATPPVYFYYDGKGLDAQPSPNYAKGNLTRVYSSISETRYKLFDNVGRLKEMEQRTPAGTEAPSEATPRVSRYTYNLSGVLIEEEYPSGRVVKNHLEPDGDIGAVSSRVFNGDFKTYATGFSYTASGGVNKMMLGNGRWETAQFNSRQQVTQLGLGTSATDASLWKVDYEYGEVQSDGSVDSTRNTGNIARQILTIPGTSFTQSYKYDPLYRLTEAKEVTGANINWTQAFGYDIYGNRTSFAKTIGGVSTNGTPSVSASTNRFTSAGFSYDKNGNVTADIDPVTSQARQTAFNGDNKQVEVKDANGNSIGKYYYDGEGNRVKKVTATETTIFVYDGDETLVAEYSTQVNPQPDISYLTSDLLDSPRVITGATGNVISRRDFMPFGEEIYAGVGARSTALKYSLVGTDNIRKRFTGYEKDAETELDFAENRMYQNKHGRFMSVDPLIDSGYLFAPQTFNRYVYTGNNPVNFVDPDGLDYYQDKKNGVIHYYPGSDEHDGFTNITGQAREITGAGCDELGNCANAGDLLFFHSDSIEFISILRQEQEARDSGMEVHGGVNSELMDKRSDVVTEIISHGQGQLIPINQEAPAIHDLLMGASPTLDTWEPPIITAGVLLGILKYTPGTDEEIIDAGHPGLPGTSVPVKRIPHGNSLNSSKPQNVYRIDNENGLYKIGVSGQKTRVRDGMPYRTTTQVNKLSRETGKQFEGRVMKRLPNRRAGREYETKVIRRYSRRFGRPPGNPRDR